MPADRYDEVIDRYVRIPEPVMGLGDFAVIIHQPHFFMERVESAADELQVRLDCGFVDYSGRPPSLNTVGLIYCKRKRYKYEREFRFSFESQQKGEGPLVLDMGDLSDIDKLFRTRDINDRLTITHGEPVSARETTEGSLGW